MERKHEQTLLFDGLEQDENEEVQNNENIC